MIFALNFNCSPGFEFNYVFNRATLFSENLILAFITTFSFISKNNELQICNYIGNSPN